MKAPLKSQLIVSLQEAKANQEVKDELMLIYYLDFYSVEMPERILNLGIP